MNTNSCGALLGAAGLVWILGCSGAGGPNPPPPPPPPPPPAVVPDVAGTWSGTETFVFDEGGSCPGHTEGTRSGTFFRVTQSGAAISMTALVDCERCNTAGTIFANGAFTTVFSSGPSSGIRVNGNVVEGRMTARRRPYGSTACQATANYDLTRE